MPDLIAYIPVLNRRHLDWFEKYSANTLYLISQEMAESFLPRLARNIVAIETDKQAWAIRAVVPCSQVEQIRIFDPSHWPLGHEGIILPDEEISHLVVEKYFGPGANTTFDMIWARYDMTAVQRQSPVIADVEVSSDEIDLVRMEAARKIAATSPDWWRQIGAAIWQRNKILACAHNEHFPDEYTTYALGDPRLNVDAGQKGKYSSIHAENNTVALCSEAGHQTRGAALYCTTFPCEMCARVIAVAGIGTVYFEEGYSVLDAQEVLRSRGVRIVQVRRKDPVSA